MSSQEQRLEVDPILRRGIIEAKVSENDSPSARLNKLLKVLATNKITELMSAPKHAPETDNVSLERINEWIELLSMAYYEDVSGEALDGEPVEGEDEDTITLVSLSRWLELIERYTADVEDALYLHGNTTSSPVLTGDDLIAANEGSLNRNRAAVRLTYCELLWAIIESRLVVIPTGGGPEGFIYTDTSGRGVLGPLEFTSSADEMPKLFGSPAR